MQSIRIFAAIALLSQLPLSSSAAQPVGRLRSTHRTPARVGSEELDLQCTEASDRELDCVFQVRWQLENPEDHVLQPALLVSFNREFAHARVLVGQAEIANWLPETRPVQVIIPPHETIEVTLEVSLRLPTNSGSRGAIPEYFEAFDPLHARHPLLSDRWEVVRRGFTWTRPSDLHFEQIGGTRVRARLPAAWTINESSGQVAIQNGTTTLTPHQAEHRAELELSVERRFHTELLRHGGPFLALGGAVDGAFRGRLGYEIGVGEYVLFQVAADTDFQREAVIAGLLEVASWTQVILPSLSFGLGVPVRVAPEARAGIRIEASATLFAAAFVASFDVWPEDNNYMLSLFGRVGL